MSFACSSPAGGMLVGVSGLLLLLLYNMPGSYVIYGFTSLWDIVVFTWLFMALYRLCRVHVIPLLLILVILVILVTVSHT